MTNFLILCGPGLTARWPLPAILQPPAASAALSVVWLLGAAFALILTGYAILVIRRRVRLSIVETGLLLVWLSAIALSSIVVLDERRNVGGDWGLQALVIAGPVAQILAIVPIYYALRALATYAPAPDGPPTHACGRRARARDNRDLPRSRLGPP